MQTTTSPTLPSLIVATHNAGKIREIREILPGWTISGEDAGVEETGSTFAENARIKARAVAARHPGAWVLADDSGLVVDALGGALRPLCGQGRRHAGQQRAPSEEPRRRCRPARALRLRPRLHRARRRGTPFRGALRGTHRRSPLGGGRLRLRPPLHPRRPRPLLRGTRPRREERHLAPRPRPRRPPRGNSRCLFLIAFFTCNARRKPLH